MVAPEAQPFPQGSGSEGLCGGWAVGSVGVVIPTLGACSNPSSRQGGAHAAETRQENAGAWGVPRPTLISCAPKVLAHCRKL